MVATCGEARARRAIHCRPLVTVVWYRTPQLCCAVEFLDLPTRIAPQMRTLEASATAPKRHDAWVESQPIFTSLNQVQTLILSF